MKAISLASILAVLLATACNSSGNGNGDKDTSGTNLTGVENVNGNIPDTSNSMNLGAKDTAHATQDTQPR